MRGVTVTSVSKVDGTNRERVKCVKRGSGTSWGDIEEITFIAPEGTHHVGKVVEIQEIEGTLGYGR